MAVAEAEPARFVVLDRVPALVDEAVVVEAEEDEVSEARLAALRPGDAVVGLEEAPALAAREAAAAAVAGLERPAERGRDRASAAAEAQGESVALDHRHGLGVTTQAACGLRRDHGPLRELAAAGVVGGEGCGIDVHVQTRALGVVPVASLERGLGELDERLDLRRARGLEGERRIALGIDARSLLLAPPFVHPLACGLERLDEERAVLGGKAGAQVEGAVVREVVVDVLELVRLPHFLGGEAAEGTERELELGGGERFCQLEQPFLGGRGRDPGQGTHLAVRERSAGEGRANRGQLLHGLGDAQVLARLPSRHPEAEGEPADGLVCELTSPQVGGHQFEPARSGRVQVRGERRELVLEALLRPVALAGLRLRFRRCLHCQPG